MHAFLDFEASSLSKSSYPIEVAWVFEDGRSEAYLIKPVAQWSDWSEDAEDVHRISRSMLETDGLPHDVVAHRMIEVLSGHELYASAPSWDGKWLSRLLRAAGLPRHALRLKDSDEAQVILATELLRPVAHGEELTAIVTDVVERVRKTADMHVVRHRALDDAEQERQKWLAVGRLAINERRLIASRRSARHDVGGLDFPGIDGGEAAQSTTQRHQ